MALMLGISVDMCMCVSAKVMKGGFRPDLDVYSVKEPVQMP
jgi:hypothetical protein